MAGLILVIYVGVEYLCGLDQGWQTFCKGLDMRHFRLCRPYYVCHNSSTLPLQRECSNSIIGRGMNLAVFQGIFFTKIGVGQIWVVVC